VNVCLAPFASMAGSAPQYASLYVGDLHQDVTEAVLYEIFNTVGPVGSIRVCRDSISRRSLGYGYVNFLNVKDAELAIDNLNYSSIKGRSCRIMWCQRDPSLRKNAKGNIFVKNLDTSIDNKALYDTFSLFGNIVSCKVSTGKDGKSRGYGFVHFETEDAAKQAIERVNGMQIGEKTVEVSVFKDTKERSDGKDVGYTNLYVKNMPAGFDDAAMKEMFSPFGAITSSTIMEDKQNRKFAFVNYENADDAKKAVEALNGKDIRTDEQKAASDGKEADESEQMYVGRAQTKAERARELAKQSGGKPAAAAAPAAQTAGVNPYVKNLDEETDDAALKVLFSDFGNVTSAAAMKDEKGRCKGFGFVSFSSPGEATKAVTEMHLKVVNGKPLYVGLAEKRGDRQERLRQRYMPAGGKGGKDGGKGKGKADWGAKGAWGAGGAKGSWGAPGGAQSMMGQQGGMMGAMMGMGGAMMGAGPQMGMMAGAKGGMMMNPMMMQQMMGKGMARPPMGMMGAPQMMGMMGQGGKVAMPPQMMMGKGAPMMGGMGMMRPMMPGQPMMAGVPPVPQQMQAAAVPQAQPPSQAQLTAASLAAAPANVQKQMLGEKLFPAITKYQPELAGKITGMMLEMDNSELLMLLESDAQLKAKVEEAMRVIEGGRTA